MGLVDDDVSHIFSNIETIAHFHRVMVMDVENTPPEHIAQVESSPVAIASDVIPCSVHWSMMAAGLLAQRAVSQAIHGIRVIV